MPAQSWVLLVLLGTVQLLASHSASCVFGAGRGPRASHVLGQRPDPGATPSPASPSGEQTGVDLTRGPRQPLGRGAVPGASPGPNQAPDQAPGGGSEAKRAKPPPASRVESEARASLSITVTWRRDPPVIEGVGAGCLPACTGNVHLGIPPETDSCGCWREWAWRGPCRFCTLCPPGTRRSAEAPGEQGAALAGELWPGSSPLPPEPQGRGAPRKEGPPRGPGLQ